MMFSSKPSEEEGVYYALDLGGTNFRVLRVQLSVDSGIEFREFAEVSIPPQFMVGTPEAPTVMLRATCKNLIYFYFSPQLYAFRVQNVAWNQSL
ncbi:hypothetical protein L1987_53795 [Smallanthus sonchifolius]|uniref:Uncharacterized protein n=1 Tax=Smallanthus sonchifolius TaxID=185202 RepID=A0ACB9EXA8_9ASTR|nr:hypothetical protein L1987_53795 [Smallanthus sonchifolius]